MLSNHVTRKKIDEGFWQIVFVQKLRYFIPKNSKIFLKNIAVIKKLFLPLLSHCVHGKGALRLFTIGAQQFSSCGATAVQREAGKQNQKGMHAFRRWLDRRRVLPHLHE